jgi:hypothetical protein
MGSGVADCAKADNPSRHAKHVVKMLFVDQDLERENFSGL